MDKLLRSQKQVQGVAVSVLGEDTSAVRKFLKTTKVTFPLLMDLKGRATEAWAGRYIPGTCPLQNLYLVDSQGIIRFTTHLPGISSTKLKGEFGKLK